MPSTLRTVVIQSRFGLQSSVPAWPLGEPGELLDYSADLTALLADAANDALYSVSLTMRPSGVGESSAVSVVTAGALVTAALSGGPPGRDYLCKFECVTIGGRTFEVLVRRPIDPLLGCGRGRTAPPSRSFGAPVNYVVPGSSQPATLFDLGAVITNVAAASGGQAGATPLTGARNAVTQGSAGMAVKLQVILGNEQKVFNALSVAVGIYPSEGTQILDYGLNVPQQLAPGGVAMFTFDGTQTWYVG